MIAQLSRAHRVLTICLLCASTASMQTWANEETAPEGTGQSWSFSTQTMGTIASVQVADDDSLRAADLAYEALVLFHHADSLLSNWTDQSEIARVNREAGEGWVTLGPQMGMIVETTALVHEESEGAFDPSIEALVRAWGFLGGTPRVPSPEEIEEARSHVGWQKVQWDPQEQRIRYADPELRLDLGGIAKGYSVDLVAARMDAAGSNNFLVDLSGNIAARGAPPGRDAWRIGVRDPRDLLPHLGILELHDRNLASSGNYEQFIDKDGRRYGHILDPRSGWPAEGLAGVTVIAASAMLADAWATALFVLGSDAARELAASRDDLSCIIIERGQDERLVVWVEEALRPIYTPHSALNETATLNWF